MGLSIRGNVTALNIINKMSANTHLLNQTRERLATGLRVNKGSDGPAKLIISENLRSKIEGYKVADRSLQDAENLIATAEGSLVEVEEALRHSIQLIIAAQNRGVNSEDQIEAYQLEIDNILRSINRIGNTSKFADTMLFLGDWWKTAKTVGDPSYLGLRDIYVPPLSQINSGTHTLAVRSFPDVTAIDFSGVTGENGRITDQTAETAINPVFSNNAAGDRMLYVDPVSGQIKWRDDRGTADLRTSLALAGLDTESVQFAADSNSVVYYENNGQIYRGSNITSLSTMGIATPNTNPDTPEIGGDKVVYESLFPIGDAIGSFAVAGGTIGAVATLENPIGIADVRVAVFDGVDTQIRSYDNAGGAGAGPLITINNANIQAMTVNGNDIYAADINNDEIHVYNALTGVFSHKIDIAASVSPGILTGAPTLGLTQAPAVANPAAITAPGDYPQDFVVTLTHYGTDRVQYTVTSPAPWGGSYGSGLVNINPLGATTIDVSALGGGVTLQLTDSATPAKITSLGTASTIMTEQDSLFVRVNNGPAQRVVFSNTDDTGLEIASAIQTQVNPGSPVDLTAQFAAGKYELTSNIPGTLSNIQVLSGSGAYYSGAGAATTLDPLQEHKISVSMNGGGFVTRTLTGALNSGANIANAISTALPGVTAVYDGGSNKYILEAGSGNSILIQTDPTLDDPLAEPPTNDASDELLLTLGAGAFQTRDVSGNPGLELSTGVFTAGDGFANGNNYTFTLDKAGSQATGLAVIGGTLYIADSDTDRVYTYDDATGNPIGSFTIPSIVDYGAMDERNGRLLFSRTTNGNIFEYNPATLQITSMIANPSGSSAVTGIGVNPADANDLFIANQAEGRVYNVSTLVAANTNILQQQGTSYTAIANTTDFEENPSYSFDGQFITYMRNNNIYRNNASGTDERQLTAGVGTDPKLNRDGSLLMYQDGANLTIANAANGAIVNVIPNATDGEFSPDNNLLLYERGGSTLVARIATPNATLNIIANSQNGAFSFNGDRIAYEDTNENSIRAVYTTDWRTYKPGDATAGQALPAHVTFTMPTSISAATGTYRPFLTAPSVDQNNNTIAGEEIFVFRVISENDNTGQTVFEVTSAAGTLQHNNYVLTPASGVYTSNSVNGYNSGLQLQLEADAQWSVGDSFEVETDTFFAASLDEGTEVVFREQQEFAIVSGQNDESRLLIHSDDLIRTGVEGIIIEDGAAVVSNSDPTEKIGYSLSALSTYALGLHNLSIRSFQDGQQAYFKVKRALDLISMERGKMGAKIHEFITMSNSNGVALERLTSSESAIRDTDYAQAIVDQVRQELLSNVQTNMLTQANFTPASLVGLLSSGIF